MTRDAFPPVTGAVRVERPTLGPPVRGVPGWTAALVGLCGLIGGTYHAVAGDLAASMPAGQPTLPRLDPDTWVVTLSGTLQGVPRYPGASDETVVGYPGIDVHRLGEPRRFSAPDDNFSLSLYDDDRVRLGPTARFVPGRYHGNDRRHLSGLRDVRFALEPGIFAEFYPVPAIRFRGEVRHGLHVHHGIVGTLGADYVLPTSGWELSFGPRLNLGDGAFARTYFGVSSAEAARNGRVTPYGPSNFMAAGLLGAATFMPNQTWAYTAFAGYDRILGSAANSPLVRRPFGSPNQFTLGAKVSFTFAAPAPF